MLGKLMKYDFKVQLKFLGGVYGVLATIVLIACGLSALENNFSYITPIRYASKMVATFLVIATVLTVVVSFLYGVLYFRRNLFKDEGYLMNTLPVTGTQLYVSKIVTSTLCILLSCVVAVLLFGVSIRDVFWFVDIFEEMKKALGGAFSGMGILLVVSFLVMIPATLIQIFMCISLGYTWKMQSNINRDVLSVIVYIICYFVQQIVMLVAMLVFFLIAFRGISFSEMEATLNNVENASKYINSVLIAGIGYSVVVSGIMFAISIRRMNRHINLE